MTKGLRYEMKCLFERFAASFGARAQVPTYFRFHGSRDTGLRFPDEFRRSSIVVIVDTPSVSNYRQPL